MKKIMERVTKTTKKATAMVLCAALTAGCLAGCGKGAGSEISVISREEGSGTRGAFVELTGVEEKNSEGNKIDNTTVEATIVDGTQTMMTTVAGAESAIGYISLGSLNDTVKAVKVDSVAASAENINNGTYALSRPFNIVTKGEVSGTAKDFINFIMSSDGQKVISDNGYIEVESTGVYSGSGVTGSLAIAGSSSVTPVMEKLKEAYEKVNSGVSIEIQESDSTTGITATADGICDIGMASRDLKDSELSEGLEPAVIAMDGIAVIVNDKSKVENLTIDQIKSIYCGETTSWDDAE